MSVTLMWICPTGPNPMAAPPDIVHLGERLTRVKKSGQPPRPDGGPADATHETADVLHSAALRLLRRASAVDVGLRLDGPRASALSVLVYGGDMPIGRLAAIEHVTPPAITK